ncbi:MAG: FkbM family methyltransferase [Methylocystis sp.]|nr:FkbM family methyltransferase [Methylocystis sp.]
MASIPLRSDFADTSYDFSGSESDLSIFGPIRDSGGYWEPHIARVMSRLIGPSDTCLDIGANIGPFTLLMSDFTYSGRVYSFEPSPSIFALLKENVEKNGCENVFVFPLGLKDTASTGQFHTFKDIPGASFGGNLSAAEANAAAHAIFNWDFAYETTEVAFSTLDVWSEQNGIDKVDFIKIDVEGAELSVLNGGASLLARHKPKLLTEFNVKAMEHCFKISPQDYYEKLRQLYSHIYLVEEDGLHEVRSYADIASRLTDEKFWVDLLCLPENARDLPRLRPLLRTSPATAPGEREASRIKAAYFTVVPLGWLNNGGSLICRTHARNLANDLAVDLTIITMAPEETGLENKGFATALGAKAVNIPLIGSEKPKYTLPDAVLHPQERIAIRHRASDAALEEAMRELKPDVIIIDWMFSAIYGRSLFRLDVPTVMITLNREAEFFAEERRNGVQQQSNFIAALITQFRLGAVERSIHRNCDGLVALNANDLPGDVCAVTDVIPPVLATRAIRWRPRDTKDVFFVGNINHYPNRLAMEWICTRLAPALEPLVADVRFKIIGVDQENVPAHCARESVEFLGVGGKSDVTRLFTQSALFLAPIANNFGSKIKLLECVAHGTPFAATEAAMSGLPFLSAPALIDLNDPEQSAAKVRDLLSDSSRLEALSKSVLTEAESYRESQFGRWGKFLGQVLEARHRAV